MTIVPSDAQADAFAARLVDELPWLVRLAARLVRDPDAAEDLAQETIVAAWRRRDQLRDGAALRGWLRTALVRRVIDRSRSEQPTVDVDEVEAEWRDDHFTVEPERVVERAELRDELEDALARLPAIYRLPVILHDALGWTSAEIAESVGIGLPAAKQRLRRGRMMLVSALAHDDARRRASMAQPMRCWQARRQVSAYLDAELSPEAATAVETHLAGCPTCPPLYAALVGVQAAVEGLRDADTVVEAAIAGRVRAHLESERHPPPGMGPPSGRAHRHHRDSGTRSRKSTSAGGRAAR